MEALKLVSPSSLKTPYPSSDSHVYLTGIELGNLLNDIGEACLNYQVDQLNGYAEDHPKKFKTYKSHYRTILNWHRMKLQKGLEFCAVHSSLPGYYPRWICMEEKEKFRTRHGLA
jgi:hypothetical protein